eukprot:g25953.t1
MCLNATWLWKPQHNCSGRGKRLALTAQNSSEMSNPLQGRLHILAGCRLQIDGVEFTDAGNFIFRQDSNGSLRETVFQLITVE